MPVIRSTEAPVFELPGLQVTALAAPSRGATETCAWRLRLAPGTPGVPHSVDREEIFLAVAGTATARVGATTHSLRPGDALIVPAGEEFSLGNPGTEVFEAVAVLPVGGRAMMPGGEGFCPPWTV
jgi:mannose-6-phosphate isomerase-like protein (cupin superfamily)